MVRWTWWDWSLSLGLLLPSVLWRCRLGHLTRKKPVPDMTYNVFSGTLNPTLSISLVATNAAAVSTLVGCYGWCKLMMCRLVALYAMMISNYSLITLSSWAICKEKPCMWLKTSPSPVCFHSPLFCHWQGIAGQVFLGLCLIYGAIYIFILSFVLSSFYFPCLILAFADWISTILPHMVWP